MEEYFSHLMSAYRTDGSSQHAIIQLLEEWRKKLDDNFIVDSVLTFQKLLIGCRMIF